jgi:hypothetical protein
VGRAESKGVEGERLAEGIVKMGRAVGGGRFRSCGDPREARSDLLPLISLLSPKSKAF